MLETLLGTRETLSGILEYVFQAVTLSMAFLMLLLVLRVVVRREWIAATVLVAFLGATTGLSSALSPWLGVPIGVAIWIPPTVALLRFGLLTSTVGLFVIFLVGNLPISARFEHWTAGPTYWVMAAVAGLAVWGFRAALGSRSLLGDALEA